MVVLKMGESRRNRSFSFLSSPFYVLCLFWLLRSEEFCVGC